jgi:hypothetical protein
VNRGHDDIELTGINLGYYGKAILFQADYWDAPEYLPAAHSEFMPEVGAEEENRGILRIAGWLAKKNDWREQ